jgi:hypothetical protein
VTDEALEILDTFEEMLRGPTGDGQGKRQRGKKVIWKNDKTHADAMLRHLHRWDRGEKVDPDSGSHPLVHVAWRALAIAWQETNDSV